MVAPELPVNEDLRLEIVESLKFLSSQADQQLNDIASLTSKFCDVPIVLVSIIKKDTQEFFVNHGLNVDQTSREVSFCGHAILQDNLFVVPDSSKDDRFKDNPLVTGYPYVNFYAGIPLNVKGQNIGTLCLIDHKPRQLTKLQEEFHSVMAHQVEQLMSQKAFMESYLGILSQLEVTSSALESNFEMFRDVISAISHDAIAPVRTIKMLVDLGKLDDTIDMRSLMSEMEKSLDSSESLLTNLLQWGIALADQKDREVKSIDLLSLSDQISAELKLELDHKGNTLRYKGPATAWNTDENKVKFIIRNLIKNANKYTADGTISVEWEIRNDKVVLRVVDTGVGMTADQLDRINGVKYLESRTGTGGEKGFGIGLKLIHSFTRSMNGKFEVDSEEGSGTTCILSFKL